MRITKQQLKKIIKEELSLEGLKDDIAASQKQRGFKPSPTGTPSPKTSEGPASFEWADSGLTMKMSIDGTEVMGFDNQKEVRALIRQLED